MQFELRRMADHSDEAILNEIRRVAALVMTPTLPTRAFRKHSRVSPTTAKKRFGSWQKALEAAGLADRYDSSSQTVTPEEVLAEIKRVAAIFDKSKLTRPEFRKVSRVSPSTAKRYFGNWQKTTDSI